MTTPKIQIYFSVSPQKDTPATDSITPIAPETLANHTELDRRFVRVLALLLAALFPNEYITVIPNGINFDLIKKNEFKPIYKKNGDEIVLLSLGRLESEKNHTFFFNQFTVSFI